MKRVTKPRKRSRSKKPQYELRLYVTGVTHCSTKAIVNLKEICEKSFPGHYHLEIVDLYQHPEVTAREQIIAAPLLVRQHPLPVRRFVGDLSQGKDIATKLKD